MRKLFHRLPIAIVLVAGCNPYSDQQGEFNAGPVDPANFPVPYLGAGADPPGPPKKYYSSDLSLTPLFKPQTRGQPDCGSSVKAPLFAFPEGVFIGN